MSTLALIGSGRMGGTVARLAVATHRQQPGPAER